MQMVEEDGLRDTDQIRLYGCRLVCLFLIVIPERYRAHSTLWETLTNSAHQTLLVALAV